MKNAPSRSNKTLQEGINCKKMHQSPSLPLWRSKTMCEKFPRGRPVYNRGSEKNWKSEHSNGENEEILHKIFHYLISLI